MTEPDFDQIADHIVGRFDRRAALVEQLRQVWNARGAADIAQVAPAFEYLVAIGKPKEPPDVAAQIKALDR